MVKELCLDYIRCLRNIFRIKWRMSKYYFCRFMTVHFVICLPIMIYFFSMRITYFLESALFQNFWILLLLMFIIIPYFAMVHRLQDRGKSGFRLLDYIVGTFVGYILCLVCLWFFWGSFFPLPSGAGYVMYERVISSQYLGTVICARVLFFGVFFFLTREWFLGNEEKASNKFGEPYADEQNKVNKWISFLALLLVIFALFLPSGILGEMAMYYAPGDIG